jgi:hypothetical protein
VAPPPVTNTPQTPAAEMAAIVAQRFGHEHVPHYAQPPAQKATATFSLAVHELAFLQSLISEVVPLLTPDVDKDDETCAPAAPAVGTAASVGDLLDHDADGQQHLDGAPGVPSMAPSMLYEQNYDDGVMEPNAPSGPLPPIHFTLRCDGGVWVRLVDDAEDALMPLYEVGLRSISAHVHLQLGDAADGLEQAASGRARIAVSLEASHFNGNNGHWVRERRSNSRAESPCRCSAHVPCWLLRSSRSRSSSHGTSRRRGSASRLSPCKIPAAWSSSSVPPRGRWRASANRM